MKKSWPIHVAERCSSGVRNRKHTAGGSRGVGFHDVRSTSHPHLDGISISKVHTSVFASWKENAWLIHFSAWLTVVHFVFNLIVLAILLAAVTSSAPCGPPSPSPPSPSPRRQPHCWTLIAPKAAWDALAAIILTAQLCEPDSRLSENVVLTPRLRSQIYPLLFSVISSIYKTIRGGRTCQKCPHEDYPPRLFLMGSTTNGCYRPRNLTLTSSWARSNQRRRFPALSRCLTRGLGMVGG